MTTRENTIAANEAMAQLAVESDKAARDLRAMAMKVAADRSDAILAGRDPGPTLADHLAGRVQTEPTPEPVPGVAPDGSTWGRKRDGSYAWIPPSGEPSIMDASPRDLTAPELALRHQAKEAGYQLVPEGEYPTPPPGELARRRRWVSETLDGKSANDALAAEPSPAEAALAELKGVLAKPTKSPADYERIAELRRLL